MLTKHKWLDRWQDPPDPPECPCGEVDGCPECNDELEWETSEEYRVRQGLPLRVEHQ